MRIPRSEDAAFGIRCAHGGKAQAPPAPPALQVLRTLVRRVRLSGLTASSGKSDNSKLLSSYERNHEIIASCCWFWNGQRSGCVAAAQVHPTSLLQRIRERLEAAVRRQDSGWVAALQHVKAAGDRDWSVADGAILCPVPAPDGWPATILIPISNSRYSFAAARK